VATIPPRRDRSGLLSQRAKGAGYELQARRYLECAGLAFTAANVAVRGGEIDLIMRDGQTWVFVEVRYRRSAAYGDAAASVTYRKQRRLLHTAAVWLAGRGASFETSSCRFDVLAITGSQLEWIPNAFSAD
jgi:putative endonuclease